jgi:hypothetical protein
VPTAISVFWNYNCSIHFLVEAFKHNMAAMLPYDAKTKFG